MVEQEGELKKQIHKEAYTDDWDFNVTATEDSDKVVDSAKKEFLELGFAPEPRAYRKLFEKWFGE